MPSTLGIVASAVFTPLDLGPAMWFDAADTSTITSSGSPAKVSEWRDKSGNGYHASQATAARQPTTGAFTQNGLNALTFSAADTTWMSTSSGGFDPAANGVTIFVVTNVDSSDSPKTALSQEDGTGLGRTILDTDAAEIYRCNFGGLPTLTLTTANIDTVLHTISCASGSSQTLTLSANAGAQTASDTKTLDAADGAVVIGVNKNKGLPWNGKIMEIIMFGKTLSATEQSLMETYLNNKWAIY